MDNLEKVKQISEFKNSLKEKNLEELKQMEQDIIKKAEEIDKETSNLEFEMPKENYKEAATGIRMMLNKKTVEWRFALGMVAMFDFWDPDVRSKTIKYPMLDSTLRTLGELQFTGYNEWASVVAVNKYFEGLRQQYVDATEKIYDIAAQHSAIIDELKIKDPNFANEIDNMNI
jgi:hypothetical protein